MDSTTCSLSSVLHEGPAIQSQSFQPSKRVVPSGLLHEKHFRCDHIVQWPLKCSENPMHADVRGRHGHSPPPHWLPSKCWRPRLDL